MKIESNGKFELAIYFTLRETHLIQIYAFYSLQRNVF